MRSSSIFSSVFFTARCVPPRKSDTSISRLRTVTNRRCFESISGVRSRRWGWSDRGRSNPARGGRRAAVGDETVGERPHRESGGEIPPGSAAQDGCGAARHDGIRRTRRNARKEQVGMRKPGSRRDRGADGSPRSTGPSRPAVSGIRGRSASGGSGGRVKAAGLFEPGPAPLRAPSRVCSLVWRAAGIRPVEMQQRVGPVACALGSDSAWRGSAVLKQTVARAWKRGNAISRDRVLEVGATAGRGERRSTVVQCRPYAKPCCGTRSASDR